MSASVTINIQISDQAVKTIMVGAVVLGIAYVVYKLIENMDDSAIPLPQEAKDFAQLPEVTPQSFDQIGGHPEVRARTVKLFQDKHYVSAVREASVALFDVIRRKSGVQADSTTLVQKVFCGPSRILKFVDVAPPHIVNAEDGLVGHLESFAKHTRKIHMHASIDLTDHDALIQINLAAYLADRVERHARPVFPEPQSR
ncbi:MAG: hypothetical protein JNK21_16540 [Rhodospirillaceae bacterium]|nr:hypothetical protein [Rhodospirillaceae bacterium]